MSCHLDQRVAVCLSSPPALVPRAIGILDHIFVKWLAAMVDCTDPGCTCPQSGSSVIVEVVIDRLQF